MTHVDDWLDEPPKNESERLAKEWLEHYRRPVVDVDRNWLCDRVLSCEYKGKRHRCIGCSRLGDVWLTTNFSREYGYDLRVDVAECSKWEMYYR